MWIQINPFFFCCHHHLSFIDERHREMCGALYQKREAMSLHIWLYGNDELMLFWFCFASDVNQILKITYRRTIWSKQWWNALKYLIICYLFLYQKTKKKYFKTVSHSNIHMHNEWIEEIIMENRPTVFDYNWQSKRLQFFFSLD